MGRYLLGTEGFFYKYRFAAQPANLDLLAERAGCGRGGMEPLLAASMDSIEKTLEVPVMELLRERVLRTGDAEEFLEILFRGNIVPSHLGKEVAFQLPDLLVGLTPLLDERLPAVAERVHLCARAHFEIERKDYPALVAYVNRHLPGGDALRLERALSEEALEIAAEKLGHADDYLPALALCILNHAITLGLDRIAVREESPEIDLGLGPMIGTKFWEYVRTEAGPEEIIASELPSDSDALFTRGLIELWSGARDAAKATLLRSNERGDARADRWLKALGVALAPRFRRAAPHAQPRHEAALEAALTLREKQDTPEARARAAEQRALEEATRQAMFTLSRALWSKDAERLTAVLSQWPFGVSMPHSDVAEALSVIINHGDQFLIARSWSSVSKRIDRDALGTESHVAYNLASAAAVLGGANDPAAWKPQVLDWLRIAKRCGDHPRDALTDTDFACYRQDPDLLALAAEP